MPHYGQSESKLYRQTLLQCAFNKGCYCPGDAEWIWGWGLCGPGWVGPQRACSSVRPPSVACLLIPVRRASRQHRKLFAVRRTCQEIHKYITFHFENITKDQTFIKKPKWWLYIFSSCVSAFIWPAALTNISKSFLHCTHCFMDRLGLNYSAGSSCDGKLTRKPPLYSGIGCEWKCLVSRFLLPLLTELSFCKYWQALPLGLEGW